MARYTTSQQQAEPDITQAELDELFTNAFRPVAEHAVAPNGVWEQVENQVLNFGGSQYDHQDVYQSEVRGEEVMVIDVR